MPLKFAGTCIAYGAPSEVTPAQELTGNFPSHNGAAVAAGIETKKIENSIEIERLTSMKQHNPKYVLRNYLAQEAIEAAEKGDFSVAEQLHEVLKNPFDEQVHFERYAVLPPDWASHISVSCSS